MDINARKEELAQAYMRENPATVFQTYIPGTLEWEAAIYDAAGLIACGEADVIEDASHLYHCPNSAAQVVLATEPDRYQAIVARVHERGY